MRNLLLIVLLFSISSCLVSDNSYKKRKVVLSIQNSPCKGNCYVYKITYYSDGTGLFNGIKNTQIGEQNFRYSTSDLDEIILYSEEINFSEIGNRYYNRGLQDLQVKTIFIKGHSVKYNENPKEELRELYHKITTLFPVPVATPTRTTHP